MYQPTPNEVRQASALLFSALAAQSRTAELLQPIDGWPAVDIQGARGNIVRVIADDVQSLRVITMDRRHVIISEATFSNASPFAVGAYLEEAGRG